MKKFLANLIQRLTSRKFLLTVGTALILIANQQYNELVLLITAYIGAEGIGDAAQRYQAEKTKQSENILQDTKLQFGELASPEVDRGNIVTGENIPM